MGNRSLEAIRVGLRFLWPLLIFLCGLAVAGVVGNRADAAVLSLIPFLSQTVTISIWLLLLSLLVVTTPLVLATIHYFRSQSIFIKLLRLDDTLLRLIASYTLNANSVEATKRLFEEFLQDALELFTDGCRISILIPDGEYLRIQYSLRIPPETIARAKFYIGPEPNIAKGIAGKAYLEKDLCSTCLSWQAGEWKADEKEYHFFTQRKTRKSMPYQAVAAVPLLNDTDSENCLGVLCLDSQEPGAFASDTIKEGLHSVASRVSSILLILKSLDP